MTAFSDQPASIDRREAVRRVVLVLGGIISAPTLAGMLAGCETPAVDEAGWTPRVLDRHQGSLVATIADHIIPATDTPGAREAGAHRFIDLMLAEYYSADERNAFLAGLADVDRRATASKGKSFLDLSPADQHSVLAALDGEAYAHPSAGAASGTSDERGQAVDRGRTENATAAPPTTDAARTRPRPTRQPFFRTMKELTLLGYYTSQIGATQELKYARVPGRFDGCAPLATIGRAWST